MGSFLVDVERVGGGQAGLGLNDAIGSGNVPVEVSLTQPHRIFSSGL